LMRRSAAEVQASEGAEERLLSLRVSASLEPAVLEKGMLSDHLASCRMLSVESAKQGLSLDLRYRVVFRLDSTASALVKALNQKEGVQSVRLQDMDVEDDD